jgi:hypothetical protein
MTRLTADSVLGVLACLALVLATNALFVADWPRFWSSAIAGIGVAGWLLKRILSEATDENPPTRRS